MKQYEWRPDDLAFTADVDRTALEIQNRRDAAWLKEQQEKDHQEFLERENRLWSVYAFGKVLKDWDAREAVYIPDLPEE